MQDPPISSDFLFESHTGLSGPAVPQSYTTAPALPELARPYKYIEQSYEALFQKCFCNWKEMLPLTDEDWHKYLHWVEQLMVKRVRGIMEANRRNYRDDRL